MAGYSRGSTAEVRGAWSRWTCDRECRGETATARGDQHDDIAVLTGAQEAVRLLSGAVTDVDTTTYRGDACVTPEAAQDALCAGKNQLTGMLREPPEGESRWNWR
ncbi:hypothetical protein GCM10010330_66740 [Streptomyces tendae]|uniref:hypothetical protein n=1 Tax=Streptomyces tendae TaxID=1932 RepID=UPI00167AEE21|nr:hypothetical protein [Streptomyces tendae]GHB03143.1 hypothetical protein GCM10010330_66740 [Streptomyces tendae]